MIALFGGAAGSGKTTVAGLWCEEQRLAVHLEFDAVRNLIVSGRADPQILSPDQAQQYEVSVRACAALARSFSAGGFAVAIDEVFEPEPTRQLWSEELKGLDVRIVVLHPPLEIVLARGAARSKRVMERHIRAQHAAVEAWPQEIRVDSANQNPSGTLAAAISVLASSHLVNSLVSDDV